MGVLRWDIQREQQARAQQEQRERQEQEERLKEVTDQLDLAFAAVVTAAEAALNRGEIDEPAVQALRNWSTEMTARLGLASRETMDKHLHMPAAIGFVLRKALSLAYAINRDVTFLASINPPTLLLPYVPAEIVSQLHASHPLSDSTSNSLAKASDGGSNPFRPVSRNLLGGGITSKSF
ncbi:hypothetical protein JCM11491_003992 [Sporobolomyces phaffii]